VAQPKPSSTRQQRALFIKLSEVDRIARILDEAYSRVETSFDYVTDMEGDKLFRRRK
jgi:hypothetical protein